MAKDKAQLDAHIAQWLHNRSLISRIPASHPDWIVTVAFYTAVHAVDAALAAQGITAWNHETRFTAIAGIHKMQKIGLLYQPLYDLSRKVRYIADPNSWIKPDLIESQVIRARLFPLEQSVEKLIGVKLDLPNIDLAHLTI